MGNGFTWHTRLAHPNKQLSTQQISYTYLIKTNFWNKKNFYTRLKEPITWHTYLVHPKRNLYPKKFLYLSKKAIFQTKKNLALAWKNRFSTQRKNFLYLPEKINNFPPKEKFHIISTENNFPNKKNLIQIILIF